MKDTMERTLGMPAVVSALVEAVALGLGVCNVPSSSSFSRLLFLLLSKHLNVNEASFEHIAHTLVNLSTLSAIGTNFKISLNISLSYVPSNAAQITTFPLFAHRSQNATTSPKNCPSSIPITS